MVEEEITTRERVRRLVKNITKLLFPPVLLIGAIALSALIFMVLWNIFLVPAVGVATLSFWLAVKGWLFVYFLTAMVAAAKQLKDAIESTVIMYFAGRQMKRMQMEQGDLLRHFMGGGQVQDE